MKIQRRRVPFRPRLDLKASRGASAHAGWPDTVQQKDLLQTDAPRIEVDFRQLEDGRLIELVEDAADATKTRFIVFDNGKAYLADQVFSSGELLVPTGRSTEGLQEIRLPRTLKPYPSVEQLLWWVQKLIRHCVSLPDIYSLVVASFVVYSWFADRLPTAVYLMVTGPPQSGKTTLLAMLQLLCRRALLVADISPAAALDVCSRYGATLLIDENEWKRDRNSRILLKHLRAGTTRALWARQVHTTRHSFGAKVLTALELPDDPALNSRCIHIPMDETYRADLLKPWDPQVLKMADYLQGALLQFRVERYGSVSPEPMRGSEGLRPRARDLLGSLIAPMQEVGDWTEVLLAFFREYHDPETRNLLSPDQSAVLAGMFLFIHSWDKTGQLPIDALAGVVNNVVHTSGEKFRLSPHKVGRVVSGLGFSSRGRTSRGQFIWLDSETRTRVHIQMRRHGSHYLGAEQLKRLTANCRLCQGQALGGPKASTA